MTAASASQSPQSSFPTSDVIGGHDDRFKGFNVDNVDDVSVDAESFDDDNDDDHDNVAVR